MGVCLTNSRKNSSDSTWKICQTLFDKRESQSLVPLSLRAHRADHQPSLPHSPWPWAALPLQTQRPVQDAPPAADLAYLSCRCIFKGVFFYLEGESIKQKQTKLCQELAENLACFINKNLIPFKVFLHWWGFRQLSSKRATKRDLLLHGTQQAHAHPLATADKQQHWKNLKQTWFSLLLCSYLSSEIQHRCRIDAVVRRTSRDVRTRQNISP